MGQLWPFLPQRRPFFNFLPSEDFEFEKLRPTEEATSEQNGCRQRREGQEAVRPAMRSVPLGGGRRQAQDRTQSLGILGQEDWRSRRIQLHRSQSKERHYLG